MMRTAMKLLGKDDGRMALVLKDVVPEKDEEDGEH
jgi:hypothetical protein